MADFCKAYPEGLTEHQALKNLIYSCEKLLVEMPHLDPHHPTIFYLKRNIEWAKVVLERKDDEKIEEQYSTKECVEYAISCLKNRDSRGCTIKWLERALVQMPDGVPGTDGGQSNG